MRKTLILLHLMGVAGFFGSALGHVVASLTVPWGDEPLAVLTARGAILDATALVTLPGLGLAVATGVALAALAALRRTGPRPAPWLALHGGLGLLILANALLLVVPAGQVMAAEAARLGGPAFDAVAYLDALKVEAVAGGLNLAAAVATAALAVAKPAWRRYGAGCPSTAR